MVKKIKQFNDEVNELKQFFITEMVKTGGLEDMPEELIIVMKRMFKLMDTAMEVTTEMGESLDSMNDKLDLLLARKEES
jgi:hypothetical protein